MKKAPAFKKKFGGDLLLSTSYCKRKEEDAVAIGSGDTSRTQHLLMDGADEAGGSVSLPLLPLVLILFFLLYLFGRLL